jgi:hypothetical protein
MDRLDAIEKEAAELRKIIERGDSEEYDHEKLYVAEIHGCVYLLFGATSGVGIVEQCDEKVFCWASFETNPSQQIWAQPKTAEDALKEARICGTVYTFSDHKEGMAFFAKRYAELN